MSPLLDRTAPGSSCQERAWLICHFALISQADRTPWEYRQVVSAVLTRVWSLSDGHWSYQLGPVQRALKGCCRLLPPQVCHLLRAGSGAHLRQRGRAFSPASHAYCYVDFVLFCINIIWGVFLTFFFFLWCTNLWDIIPKLKIQREGE